MTAIVGILNITPDSFSDGGSHTHPEAVLESAKAMVKAGASVLDIGAESTRPSATPLSPEEEWKRLAPVLDILQDTDTINAWLSVDTRHAETAKRAILTGVDWINDVSGFTDPKMLEAVVDSEVKICCMHHVTIPADPKITLPDDCDVVGEITRWAEKTINRLINAGIARDRIILDPGLGFGKTAQQSWELLERVDELTALETPWLVGHSRKSFLSLITDKKAAARDPETATVSSYLANEGVQYLRVHNVTANADAMKSPSTSLPDWRAGVAA